MFQKRRGHRAHENGWVAIDAAMEKIGDAVATKNNAGIDHALVKQAQDALEAEDGPRARALLLSSITVALRDLPPATGEETGTKAVSLPLRGRGDLSDQDRLFGAVSALLLGLGVMLAYRFRPHDSVRQLRASLVAAPPQTADDHSEAGR
mgnify:CR=1 FL=1